MLLAGLAACAGQPRLADAPGPPGDPWGPYIREASARFDVPEAWVRAVMRQESGGRPSVVSRAGAIGLMQVMPGTYVGLRRRHGLGGDPYDPRDNVLAGTAYMREMYEQFGAPGFLAAYNAGPNRLAEALAGGRVLPLETRTYLARVGPQLAGAEPRRAVGAAPPVQFAAAATEPLPGVVISYVPDPDPADLVQPVPVAAPASAGTWAVQVAALPSPLAARILAEAALGAVTAPGARVEVQPVAAGALLLHRARVGGLARSEAEAACSRLRVRGDCLVVPSLTGA